MMRFVKAVFRIVIGIVFGLVASAALVPAVAAVAGGEQAGTGAAVLIAITALCGLIGLFAPTVRRAFGRGFLIAGVSLLALPLSTLMLSGRAAHEVVTKASATGDAAAQAGTAIGAGLAGVAITGVATFIGLIAGGIFIILGLVLALGGRREVIVVERRQA